MKKKVNLNDYKPRFTRRQITSFTLEKETKDKLDQLEHPSSFVKQLVETHLGVCPTCHQHWPKKK